MKQSITFSKNWQNISINFLTENEGFLFNFRSFIDSTLEHSWNTSLSKYCCRKGAGELEKFCKEQCHFQGRAIFFF